MNLQRQIIKLLGEKQIGIKFNGEQFKGCNSPKKPKRFCEAVIASLNSPMVLSEEDLDCLGARRSFGFDQNDQKLARHIYEETNISLPFIFDALNKIPVMDIPVKNIVLGTTENPDIIIAIVKPGIITKLVILYAKYFEEKPLVSPYFFMSVCANIAVQTFKTVKICISYGCPESRNIGGILEDEVIVGIPNLLVVK